MGFDRSYNRFNIFTTALAFDLPEKAAGTLNPAHTDITGLQARIFRSDASHNTLPRMCRHARKKCKQVFRMLDA